MIRFLGIREKSGLFGKMVDSRREGKENFLIIYPASIL